MHIAYHAFVISSSLKQICGVVLASIFTAITVSSKWFFFFFNFKSYLKKNSSIPQVIGDPLYFTYVKNYYICCVVKSYHIQQQCKDRFEPNSVTVCKKVLREGFISSNFWCVWCIGVCLNYSSLASFTFDEKKKALPGVIHRALFRYLLWHEINCHQSVYLYSLTMKAEKSVAWM